MTEEPKTATEIARKIKEQAYLSLGPWPIDLQIFIFGTTSGWRSGLSPATRASDSEYRESVLQIARELQSTVSLVRSPDASQEKPAGEADRRALTPRATRQTISDSQAEPEASQK
jgi:hypothetical protein